MRLKTLAAVVVIAGTVGGCGYKPLDAPCAMSEGGGPSAARQWERQSTAAEVPQQAAVQALSYADARPRFVPAPFRFDTADDCGPLRPINAGTLR